MGQLESESFVAPTVLVTSGISKVTGPDSRDDLSVFHPQMKKSTIPFGELIVCPYSKRPRVLNPRIHNVVGRSINQLNTHNNTLRVPGRKRKPCYRNNSRILAVGFVHRSENFFTTTCRLTPGTGPLGPACQNA